METASASDVFLITRACMIAAAAVACPRIRYPVKVDDITQVGMAIEILSNHSGHETDASLSISDIFNKFFQRSGISFKPS